MEIFKDNLSLQQIQQRGDMMTIFDNERKTVGEIYHVNGHVGDTDEKYDAERQEESWLIGQFYNGTEVKMLQFRKPLTAPEKNSPMGRIYNLEDSHLINSQVILNICQFIFGKYGVDLGISQMSQEISKYGSFVNIRDSLLETDSPYMITNAELLRAQRGWKKGG